MQFHTPFIISTVKRYQSGWIPASLMFLARVFFFTLCFSLSLPVLLQVLQLFQLPPSSPQTTTKTLQMWFPPYPKALQKNTWEILHALPLVIYPHGSSPKMLLTKLNNWNDSIERVNDIYKNKTSNIYRPLPKQETLQKTEVTISLVEMYKVHVFPLSSICSRRWWEGLLSLIPYCPQWG